MIKGIGTDIVEIRRLKSSLEDRVLTPNEREQYDKMGLRQSSYLAGRWAAKEATSKALGCGIGAECSFQDINILNDDSGAPQITLAGAAQIKAKSLGVERVFISISHEKNYATAIIIMEG